MAYSVGIWRWEGSHRVTESCVDATADYMSEAELIERGIVETLYQFPDACMVFVQQAGENPIYMRLNGVMWFDQDSGKRHDAHSAYCLLQTAAMQLRETLTAIEEAGQ